MEIKEDSIDHLLQARSEIDEELQRHRTNQTVLFTDIVGSTTYFDRFGDTQGLLLLYRHDNLVKEAVGEFNGTVVKTIGDSVMAEFAEPLSAVQAAIAIQRRLWDHNLKHDKKERLQIRIGIHTGFGFRRSNDLFGDSVNIAARITKRSGPAQILVSEDVSQSIPASEILFKSIGRVNLEGKTEADELFEVIWTETDAYDGLRSSLTPPALPNVAVSVEAQPPIREVKRIPVTKLMRMEDAERIITVRLGLLAFAMRKSGFAPVLKTVGVFLSYLLISAGMVVGRADTRSPTVRETPGATKPVEASGLAKIEMDENISTALAIPIVGNLSADPPPVQDSASGTKAAETKVANKSPDGNIKPVAAPGPTKKTAAAPIPATGASLEISDTDVNTHAPSLPIAEAPPAPALETVAVIQPMPADSRPKWISLIETVPIPAGVFTMGSDSGKGDEKPGHQVKLDAFNMSRAEITNRQYRAFLEDTRYPRPKDPSYTKNYLMDYPDLPVVNVSYDDAIAFCAWASTKFNASVRLPTEAEWEYAVLSGKDGVSPFPWGTQDPKEMARFKDNAPRGVKTVAEKTFPANKRGLYNMSGNVAEWVLDFYSKDYYKTSPIRNPIGPQFGTKRSIRGGSWADADAALVSTRRSSRTASERSDEVGFRIVVTESDAMAVSSAGQ
jgi:formylglycine-generating enzyme required for sulfatase activity/class 3 adenylate cyclase